MSQAKSPVRALSRADRARETREAILDAAARLFLQSGIEGTSLDAVAAELGLTKGAIYASFPSKGALIEAVAAANSTPRDLFDPLLEAGVPLRQRIRKLGQRIASTTVDRRVVLLDLEYVIYASRNSRWNRSTRLAFEADLEALATQLREVNEASGDRLPIPELQFLRLLNIMGRGLIQERALNPNALTREDVARMIEQILV
ncbi:MAG: TetR/AcrR family transcriptional regulator [Gemmatimonadales bacterium]